MDLSFLQEIEQLRLMMKRNINTPYRGEHRSAATGTGTVFKDFTPYTPGDDFRNIDWTIYARTNELFIRRYEEEKTLNVHVLLDASASMDFAYTGNVTKFQYAAKLALGIVYLAKQAQEKYRFATFSDHVQVTTHARGLREVADHCETTQPTGQSSLQFAHNYKRFVSSKSLMFLITDCLVSPEEIEDFLRLYRKHQVIILHVYDQAERTMPLHGSLDVTDLESKSTIRTFLSRRKQEQYRHRYERHLAQIQQACRSYHAMYVPVATSQPIVDTFYGLCSYYGLLTE